jgi:hypothetical protein
MNYNCRDCGYQGRTAAGRCPACGSAAITGNPRAGQPDRPGSLWQRLRLFVLLGVWAVLLLGIGLRLLT